MSDNQEVLDIEDEGTEEAEVEETKVDLADVIDALHNRADTYEKLTATWTRGQLRKGNELLKEAFSQDSNRRWVVDVDLEDAADAVAAAWDNRKTRKAKAGPTSEDSELEIDEDADYDEEEDEEGDVE